MIPANWMQENLIYLLHVDKGHNSGMQLIPFFIFLVEV
jgi:hypothetical protein